MDLQKIINLTTGPFASKTIDSCKKIKSSPIVSSYLITFTDGFKVILKLEAAKTHFLKNNFNPIAVENEVLNLLKDKLSLKVPEVYFYDESKELINKKYIFTEYFDLPDYQKQLPSLSKDELEKIDYKSGRIVRELRDFTGETFGFPGDSKHQFSKLYDFVQFLLNNIITDAKKKAVDLTITGEALNELLEKDIRCFDCDTEPTLVHFNMLPDNLLIKDNEIFAVINWENTIYGDPLMEARFRLQKYTLPFFDGFGQSQFNLKETRRLLWYDIIYYLTEMIRSSRLKKGQNAYEEAKQLIQQCITMLQFSF